MRKGFKKAYEITDARIQFVSLVDKAANKRQFIIKKEDGGKAAFTTYGRIVKTDTDTHYVTGVVYEPMAEDSHGNFMTEAEITKAAYWFAKNGNKVDLQHSFEPLDGASVVESWIAKADFDIDGETIKKGTWLMTVEVADESVWEGIEKGKITGFSMGGLGNYSEEDVELDNVSKQETSEKKGLLKQLAKALGLNVVEKGDMAELYEERSKGTLFWNAFNSLEEILYKYNSITGRYLYETDEAKVRECLEDFIQIITSILTGGGSIAKTIQTDRPVEKAGKKMSGKNKEMLLSIYESLGTFIKEFDDPEPEKIEPTEKKGDEDPEEIRTPEKEEKQVTKQEVETIVNQAIENALSGKDLASEDKLKEDERKTTEKITEEKKKESGKTTPPNEVKKSDEITSESINVMVEDAITKALETRRETVTTEQVQEMIAAALTKALDPVLKSKGIPSHLGSSVEKSAGEQHYLHGIL